MNKSELIAAIAAKSGLTKADATRALDATIDVVKDAIAKEDSVSLVGFGTFELRKRAARVGRNPRSGKTIDIPASTSLAFRASRKAIGG